MAQMTQVRHSPNLVWTLLEGRSILELGSFFSLRPFLRRLPKGDGHPVIVFPGFLASEFSTRPLRGLLEDLGYEAYDWGLGRNLHFNPRREVQMRELLENVYKEHGRKVSLIGWSLGGVFAREIAKYHPNYVRQVISLGSPMSGTRHAPRIAAIFEALNGRPTEATKKRFDVLRDSPPVPTSSIYSKSDGIVHWEGSVQNKAPQAENIEVPVSHLGLGVSPIVMSILANRLAQKEGEWSPFRPKGLSKALVKISA